MLPIWIYENCDCSGFLKKDAVVSFFVFIVIPNSCHYYGSWNRGKEEKMMKCFFLILVSCFLAIAFDSLRDIVNNNRFDDLNEFIVILVNAKR
jgi:hypothetical protein